MQTPMNQPNQFNAHVFNGNAVRVTWSDQSQIESGYEIRLTPQPPSTQGTLVSSNSSEQGDVGLKSTIVETAPAEASAALLTGLKPGTQYYYEIAPVNSHCRSLSDASLDTASFQTKTLDGKSTQPSKQWYSVQFPESYTPSKKDTQGKLAGVNLVF
jgi:hypothetical protein